MKRTTFGILVACASVGMAAAQSMNDQIISDLQSKGYGYIEIKNGPSQTKVEAIRGTEKLEVIYDNASGQILEQEREQADQDEVGLSGVDISQRDESFTDEDDDGRNDDDDDDDGRDDDDDGREDDDDGRDDDDDDDDDDDEDEDDDDDDDDSDDDDDDDDDNSDDD